MPIGAATTFLTSSNRLIVFYPIPLHPVLRTKKTSLNAVTADIPVGVEDVSGYYLAKTPLKNKGISFSHEERAQLGLRGLFPAGEPLTLDRKIETAMENFRGKVPRLAKSFLE